jgi:hypothetical protein
MQLREQSLLVALMNRVVRIQSVDIDMGGEFWFGPAGRQERVNLLWTGHKIPVKTGASSIGPPAPAGLPLTLTASIVAVNIRNALLASRLL